MLYEPILLEEIAEKAKNPHNFIKECENSYEQRLDSIAAKISKNAGSCPIILISGPSGSGKTTSGLKLEEKLDAMGFETHILSLDNYFFPISEAERPLFEAHLLDLESPARVDRDFLNTQLASLLRGERIELPLFDFTANTRRASGKSLKLHKGELIILEGIHSLNPSVIEHAEEFSSGIYVSVRSRIEYRLSGERYLLHPSKIRLARRMIRDARSRNRTPSDTVELYAGVERGENKYIMPYKKRADYDIDTFFPYELCAYKALLPSSLPEDEARHPWLSELFEVLSGLPLVPCDFIPDASLIREFVGNGKYSD
ncbi:MAG: nucleoside kinase [Clostridia bacterium]|nr:nucleoside kinase [Clostridia bacterium]